MLCTPIIALAVDVATVQAIDSKASSAKSKADGNNSRIQALEAEDVILHQRIDDIQLTPGPKGDKGDPGDQGPKGDPGVPGADLEARQAICTLYETFGLVLPDLCLPSPPVITDHIVFITNNLFDGNLGGIAGADLKCQTAAVNAGLTGTFYAWIASDSVNSDSPSDRFTIDDRSYQTIDGKIVAASWNDLVSGSLQNPILITEYGNTINSLYDVWTNVNSLGQAIGEGNHCENWTSNASTTRGAIGVSITTLPNWTYDYFNPSCSGVARLYCFQQ